MDGAGGYVEYEFVADFYDHIVPYQNRPDIDFFVDEARSSGGPVLEVGCGTGRVLIPTARAGLEIVGLDLSENMLAACRQNVAREPSDIQNRVQLVHGDMRNFDLGRQFALATIPFRPFQHLISVEDQLSCLACVNRHLVEGGRLILDVFNMDVRRLAGGRDEGEVGEEPEFLMPDGRRVFRRHRNWNWDLADQIFDAEIIYYVTYLDGHRDRLVHKFKFRYLFRFEAQHLLARSGFSVENLFGGYDRSPYGSRYPGEMIFVARKERSP